MIVVAVYAMTHGSDLFQSAKQMGSEVTELQGLISYLIATVALACAGLIAAIDGNRRARRVLPSGATTMPQDHHT